MGPDSITFQKSTEHFSELESKGVKSSGQGRFVYLHTIYKELWPFFIKGQQWHVFDTMATK